MKRTFLYIYFSLFAMVSMADTLSIRQLFIEMPDSVIPYLSKNNRLDFIDFMDSKMKAEVTNAFGGKSVMHSLTKDSLSIALNDITKLDFYLFNVSEPVDSSTQVICLVKSYKLNNNYSESVVEYYSVNWKQLSKEPALVEKDRKKVEAAVKKQNILNLYKNLLNKD